MKLGRDASKQVDMMKHTGTKGNTKDHKRKTQEHMMELGRPCEN